MPLVRRGSGVVFALGIIVSLSAAHAVADDLPSAKPQEKQTVAVSEPAVRQAVVVRDQVHLRAGPSTAYEVVATLGRGTRLEVFGSVYGWYRVRPRAKVAVYVSRALVDCKDAAVAVVRRDRVNVRARPDLNSTVCGQVNAGEPLEVLEVDGDWVKVLAPESTRFYLHGRFVSFDLAARSGEASAPETAAAAEQPDDTPPALLARAIALYNAEIAKPRLGDMDFSAARALFERVLERAGEPGLEEAARRGLRRIAAFEKLARDYERRRAALDRALEGGKD